MGTPVEPLWSIRTVGKGPENKQSENKVWRLGQTGKGDKGRSRRRVIWPPVVSTQGLTWSVCEFLSSARSSDWHRKTKQFRHWWVKWVKMLRVQVVRDSPPSYSSSRDLVICVSLYTCVNEHYIQTLFSQAVTLAQSSMFVTWTTHYVNDMVYIFVLSLLLTEGSCVSLHFGHRVLPPPQRLVVKMRKIV